MAAMTSFYAK